MIIQQQVDFNRTEMVEFLQRQINRIPSWEEVIEMDADQVREMARRNLDFEIFRSWMQNPQNELKLCQEEIGEKWFQFFLYFIVDAETNHCFYSDYDLFNKAAAKRSLEMIKKTNKFSLLFIKLEDFLVFAKDPFPVVVQV